jgi:hypothetical protein
MFPAPKPTIVRVSRDLSAEGVNVGYTRRKDIAWAIFLATIACLLGSVRAGHSEATLASPFTTYRTSESPIAAVASPFDQRDGVDFGVLCSGDRTFQVFSGNGDGSFAQEPIISDLMPHLSSCRALALGDVSGDGRPDLVVTDDHANTVSTWQGAADGTFAFMASYAVGANPIRVSLGDCNGDGRLDIATANRNDASVAFSAGCGRRFDAEAAQEHGPQTRASRLLLPQGGGGPGTNGCRWERTI